MGQRVRPTGHGDHNLLLNRFIRVFAVMFVDGLCVSNWERSKVSDAVAKEKRERVILVVSPPRHHKSDQEFLVIYIGCI
jgi:hypothetical protein